MNRSLQRYLSLLGLGFTLIGAGVLLFVLVRLTISTWPLRPWSRIYWAICSPRETYVRWHLDRETSAVRKLVRDADICLEANGGEFTRIKPLGPDGHPVYAFGKDVMPSAVLPAGYGRRAVTIAIPNSGWILVQHTTNVSGTEMEDFALEVANKAKACGFRRITVLESSYGNCWRVFDGEVPSRKSIDATLRRQMANF